MLSFVFEVNGRAFQAAVHERRLHVQHVNSDLECVSVVADLALSQPSHDDFDAGRCACAADAVIRCAGVTDDIEAAAAVICLADRLRELV